MNGLDRFEAEANDRNWRIVTRQRFRAQSDPSLIDASSELFAIRNSGVEHHL